MSSRSRADRCADDAVRPAAFAGLFDLRRARPIDRDRLARLLGPARLWTAPGAGLAARPGRGQAQDPVLVQAPDPADATGPAAALFQGALYNGPALRRSLEAGGARFRSPPSADPDPHEIAEILLHGARAWGDALPERLDADLSAALFIDGRLTLFRDRWGLHPLYYGADATGVLIFASDRRTVSAALGGTPALDLDAVAAWCAEGRLPGGRSFFQGVSALPPGGRLTASPGAKPFADRWRCERPEPMLDPPPLNESSEELRALARDAIAKRTRDGVDMAPGQAVLPLLGDVTTYGLAHLLGPSLKGRLAAWSVREPDPNARSSRRALAAARSLSVEHWVRAADPDALGPLGADDPAILLAAELGLSDPAALSFERLLLEAAPPNAGVLFSPLGATAAFGVQSRPTRAPWSTVRRIFAPDLQPFLQPPASKSCSDATIAAFDLPGRAALAAAAGLELRAPFLDRDLTAFTARLPRSASPFSGGVGPLGQTLSAAFAPHPSALSTHPLEQRTPAAFARAAERQWRAGLPRLTGRLSARRAPALDGFGVKALIREHLSGEADHGPLLRRVETVIAALAPL